MMTPPGGCSGDLEAQMRVRGPERLLDGVRRVGAREDEAEVLPAFRQRDELLTQMGRDGDLLDVRHRLGRAYTVHGAEVPGAGGRDHHDAGGAAIPVEGRDLPAEGVAEDQLLERHPRAEAQRPRAEPADRS